MSSRPWVTSWQSGSGLSDSLRHVTYPSLVKAVKIPHKPLTYTLGSSPISKPNPVRIDVNMPIDRGIDYDKHNHSHRYSSLLSVLSIQHRRAANQDCGPHYTLTRVARARPLHRFLERKKTHRTAIRVHRRKQFLST